MIYANDYADEDALLARIREVNENDELYLAMLAANPLRHGMDFSPKRDIADYLESIIRRGNKPFEKDAWEFGDAARLHRLARGASPFALRLRHLLACLTGADRQRRHALKNALRDLKQLHR